MFYDQNILFRCTTITQTLSIYTRVTHPRLHSTPASRQTAEAPSYRKAPSPSRKMTDAPPEAFPVGREIRGVRLALSSSIKLISPGLAGKLKKS